MKASGMHTRQSNHYADRWCVRTTSLVETRTKLTSASRRKYYDQQTAAVLLRPGQSCMRAHARPLDTKDTWVLNFIVQLRLHYRTAHPMHGSEIALLPKSSHWRIHRIIFDKDTNLVS